MSAEDIENRILRIIIRDLELNITEDEVRTEGRLDELFGMDSMAIVELVVGIEKEFNIRIPDEYLSVEIFQSIKTIAEHIRPFLHERDDEDLR
jgi:acyl carrier protein